MSSTWISRAIGNVFWLLIAFAFTAIFQEIFFATAQLSTSDTHVVLGLAIFICALICDILLEKESDASLFTFITFFIMTVSIILIVISQMTRDIVLTPAPVMTTLVVFTVCKGLSRFFSSDWRFPKFMSTRVMIVGDDKSSQIIHKQINESHGRFTLESLVDFKDTMDPLAEQYHDSYTEQYTDKAEMSSDKLYLDAQKAGIQTIIVSFAERRGQMPVRQMLKCRMLGINIVEAKTFYEFIGRKLYIENLKPSDFIFAPGFTLSMSRRIIKRAADIFAAVCGLTLLAPLFPIIALIIHLDSPGPVFFRQVRVGLNDRLFHIIKFRSMRSDAEKSTGAVWATEGDPRITRVGSFLRKTRLDEIPQLINVLQGDMSLVGPRPERPEFIGELKKSIPFYGERHSVKPGVTGWAQVCYPYGASVEDALEKLRYDLYYIKNQSLLLEIEIIFRTILIVFTRDGAR